MDALRKWVCFWLNAWFMLKTGTSQVMIVTHSEVILDEALEHNLTLLLGGQADNIAAKTEIRNSLKHFGAEHYVKARERGYVGLAERLTG